MEAIEISEQNDRKAQYRALGKKLKKIEDNTTKEVHQQLEEGIESISSPTFLPEDLATYLLSLKTKVNLPASVLPSSLFKRPSFVGREDFFYRLASEIISFGIAYQRVHLQPIRLNKLTTLFHKHRPWWRCDIQDIEKALDILVSNEIITKTPEGFLFEPLTMSIEVQDFLSLISKGINEYGEISLSSVHGMVNWSTTKIETMIDLLNSNQICFVDRDKELLFFPEFKRGA